MTFLTLLQAAAVTAVACVLIVGSCADMFAIDVTGELEPGGGPSVRAARYQGKFANLCRYTMLIVVTVLAFIYTGILLLILFSVLSVPFFKGFTPDGLTNSFVIAIAITILAVGWIAFLATMARWNHMRYGN